MPTPARFATASRLASGPPALNTTFAASSTRSRLRIASVRGRRVVWFNCTAIWLAKLPVALESGGTLRIWRQVISEPGGPLPQPPPRLALLLVPFGLAPSAGASYDYSTDRSTA